MNVPGLLDSLGAVPPDRAAAIDQAATGFESLLVSQLLKQALDSEEGGLFQGGGAHVYGGLFETYLADHLVQSGGLGLHDRLVAALGGK
ncbi:MAG: hypothetical protein D6731_06055 [Planctomycetota bacterium]|nr:MAG: hypothetical protein D6731_06055 [Planctomycetota bacterium]